MLGPSIEARMSQGKALRARVSRTSHAEWRASSARPDLIKVLKHSDRGRVPELLPVRTDAAIAFCVFPGFGGSDGMGFVQNSRDRNSRASLRRLPCREFRRLC